MNLNKQKSNHYYGWNGIPNQWTNDNDRSYPDRFFDDKNYEDFYFDNFYDMDNMFGHENSLFGTRGLPVGHHGRSSKSFDLYNKLHGPMIVRVIKGNDLQEQIRRVLREEVTDRGEKLRDLSKKVGLKSAIEFAGGVNNFVTHAYNGDIKEYFKQEKVEPYSIKVGDNVSMYMNDVLVQNLNLKDYSEDEKELGDFRFGKKNSQSYKFTAKLRKVKYGNGDIAWRVIGMSGTSGFGYWFINKRDELAKTYRKQIFQQVIDKYNLDSYK